MTFMLRSTVDDVDIDLGPSLELLKVFRELALLEPHGYEALYFVPQTNEEPVPLDYLAQVADEAADYLSEHGDRVSEHARFVLTSLAGMKVP